jgi:copper chaperone CopZ
VATFRLDLPAAGRPIYLPVHRNVRESATSNASVSTPDPVALKVSGMTCEGCARTIERALCRVAGVESAKVDFDLGIGIVRGTAGATELISAVVQDGYSTVAAD